MAAGNSKQYRLIREGGYFLLAGDKWYHSRLVGKQGEYVYVGDILEPELEPPLYRGAPLYNLCCIPK